MTTLLWIASGFAFFLGWATMGVAADQKAKTGGISGYDWVGLGLFAFAVAGFSRLVAA